MAEEESKKRRLKNPETFRERAEKANVQSEKPKRASRFWRAIGRFFSAVFGPVGRSIKKVANLKVLRPLHKPARILGKIVFPQYFRDSWRELRQVTWPSWIQSFRLTFAVLIFAAAFGAVIAIVDYGLDKFFRNLLLK